MPIETMKFLMSWLTNRCTTTELTLTSKISSKTFYIHGFILMSNKSLEIGSSSLIYLLFYNASKDYITISNQDFSLIFSYSCSTVMEKELMLSEGISISINLLAFKCGNFLTTTVDQEFL